MAKFLPKSSRSTDDALMSAFVNSRHLPCGAPVFVILPQNDIMTSTSVLSSTLNGMEKEMFSSPNKTPLVPLKLNHTSVACDANPSVTSGGWR
eukprot:COSAG05_NODE_607_length_8381_cov_9.782057_6_plen_93_part_00